MSIARTLSLTFTTLLFLGAAACGGPDPEAYETHTAGLTHTAVIDEDLFGTQEVTIACLEGDFLCQAQVDAANNGGNFGDLGGTAVVGDVSDLIPCGVCSSAGGQCGSSGYTHCNCAKASDGSTNTPEAARQCRATICEAYPNQPKDFCPKQNAEPVYNEN